MFAVTLLREVSDANSARNARGRLLVMKSKANSSRLSFFEIRGGSEGMAEGLGRLLVV